MFTQGIIDEIIQASKAKEMLSQLRVFEPASARAVVHQVQSLLEPVQPVLVT